MAETPRGQTLHLNHKKLNFFNETKCLRGFTKIQTCGMFVAVYIMRMKRVPTLIQRIFRLEERSKA
ncbi:hypothetical protein GFER_07970 [Geoalkalibacter ferrihydriticus DSM 17813]|uniref:Uncharacterized protein n=1 Tax=Geoalkalibacter ferrihydriticus DSM 17813 TaxID=1121915 RepID=A0A0C2DU69_9BACT|nr:hypothetical protein GFER_07970 [Geoalkalibacter ferrihydriticus DSM 17813]